MDPAPSRRPVSLARCLLASAAFFAFAAWRLPVRFEENDDVLMLLLASGKYTGRPESHLVFIQSLFGAAVSSAYRLVPQIEWYALALALIHVMSLGILIRRIFEHPAAVPEKAAWLAGLAALETVFIAKFQFTTTAALAALAGVVQMRHASGRARWLGAAWFVIGSLLRFPVALMAAAVTLPLWSGARRQNARALWVPAAAAALCLLAAGIDRRAYADPPWAAYREYDRVRGAVQDDPRWGESARPESVSPEDFALFDRFFGDGTAVGLRELREIRSRLQAAGFGPDRIFRTLDALKRYGVLLFLLTVLLGMAVFAGPPEARKRAAALGAAAAFAACLAAAAWSHTLKPRLFLSAFLALSWVLVECGAGSPGRRARGAMTGVLLGLSAYLFLLAAEARAGNRVLSALWASQQEVLAQTDRPAVVFADHAKIEALEPFEASRRYPAGRLYFQGWLAGYPFERNPMRRYRDLVGGPAVLMHRSAVPQAVPLIQKSIWTHDRIQANYSVAGQNAEYALIRFDSR